MKQRKHYWGRNRTKRGLRRSRPWRLKVPDLVITFTETTSSPLNKFWNDWAALATQGEPDES